MVIPIIAMIAINQKRKIEIFKLEIKNIVCDLFETKELLLPSWLDEKIVDKNISLSSYLWTSNNIEKIRLCELKIDKKFYAESLVIYPKKELFLPVFGTEFLNIANKRYFGAIDFHPIVDNEHYLRYLKEFPDTKVKNLKQYDINRFFSKKFWVKKSDNNFYSEYIIWVKCYLYQYKKLIESEKTKKFIDKNPFLGYNEYMSSNDPAFGILKSYFDGNFAEKYIKQFLFC